MFNRRKVYRISPTLLAKYVPGIPGDAVLLHVTFNHVEHMVELVVDSETHDYVPPDGYAVERTRV